jgi:hypothetical protein
LLELVGPPQKAQVVRDFLVKSGIAAARLSIVSDGRTDTAASGVSFRPAQWNHKPLRWR